LQTEILSYSRARGAFVGASIDGTSISFDNATDAAYYQPPGAVPASATQLVQLISTLASGGTTTVPAPTPQPAAGVPAPASQAPNSLEEARQRLDASYRQLAAQLDDQWKQYLALPPEVYVPNQVPNSKAIEQAITRYENVSRRPQYAALANQPAFQATLQGLWQLGDLQLGGPQKLRLPPPPLESN
jgi:hypothetical protein